MASKNRPDSYADAVGGVSEALKVALEARLRDPDDHFPYQRDRAMSALREPPEEGTNNHPGHWYISEQIIEATDAMIAAQEAHLQNLDDADVKAAYMHAQNELVAARQAHRAGRPIAPVAVAGSVDEVETRQSMVRALGAAGYDAGQIATMTNRPVAEVQGALNGRQD